MPVSVSQLNDSEEDYELKDFGDFEYKDETAGVNDATPIPLEQNVTQNNEDQIKQPTPTCFSKKDAKPTLDLDSKIADLESVLKKGEIVDNKDPTRDEFDDDFNFEEFVDNELKDLSNDTKEKQKQNQFNADPEQAATNAESDMRSRPKSPKKRRLKRVQIRK